MYIEIDSREQIIHRSAKLTGKLDNYIFIYTDYKSTGCQGKFSCILCIYIQYILYILIHICTYTNMYKYIYVYLYIYIHSYISLFNDLEGCTVVKFDLVSKINQMSYEYKILICE